MILQHLTLILATQLTGADAVSQVGWLPSPGAPAVGVPVVLRLAIEGHSREEWLFPQPGTDLGTFLFLRGSVAEGQPRCELLPTLGGTQRLEPFLVTVRAPGVSGMQERRLITRPLSLRVRSVLKGRATLLDDLHLALSSHRTWGRPAAVAALALLVLCIGFLLLRTQRLRRRQAPVRSMTVAAPDPESVALAALQGLAARPVLSGGACRLLLADLADVLRRYLAARFDEHLLVKTTEELRPLLAKLAEEAEESFPEHLLGRAELAKYAALEPPPADLERLLTAAAEWVRARRFARGGGS